MSEQYYYHGTNKSPIELQNKEGKIILEPKSITKQRSDHPNFVYAIPKIENTTVFLFDSQKYKSITGESGKITYYNEGDTEKKVFKFFILPDVVKYYQKLQQKASITDEEKATLEILNELKNDFYNQKGYVYKVLARNFEDAEHNSDAEKVSEKPVEAWLEKTYNSIAEAITETDVNVIWVDYEQFMEYKSIPEGKSKKEKLMEIIKNDNPLFE